MIKDPTKYKTYATCGFYLSIALVLSMITTWILLKQVHIIVMLLWLATFIVSLKLHYRYIKYLRQQSEAKLR